MPFFSSICPDNTIAWNNFWKFTVLHPANATNGISKILFTRISFCKPIKKLQNWQNLSTEKFIKPKCEERLHHALNIIGKRYYKNFTVNYKVQPALAELSLTQINVGLACLATIQRVKILSSFFWVVANFCF